MEVMEGTVSITDFLTGATKPEAAPAKLQAETSSELNQVSGPAAPESARQRSAPLLVTAAETFPTVTELRRDGQSLGVSRSRVILQAALGKYSPFRSGAVRKEEKSSSDGSCPFGHSRSSRTVDMNKVIFRYDLNSAGLPETIVRARLPSTRLEPGLYVSLAKEMREIYSRSRDRVEARVDQQNSDRRTRAVGSMLSSDSDDEMFESVGGFDSAVYKKSELSPLTELAHNPSSERFPDGRVVSSESGIARVEETIAGAKSRFEEQEAAELREAETRRKLMEQVRPADHNPFSIKNASLVPLAQQPVYLHHKEPANALISRKRHAEQEIDVDIEYGIELEGEEYRSSNTPIKQGGKRRKDTKHKYENVVKHYKA
ncbi:hypothetical protein GNI_087290 [Gregarina niphandrodes]|uniref:Uncharacterized protein n=1 Tax=Gregarina niphandrodes TaxID=110365 RepID=A0A023B5W6_GRENI|nr:hypothetical protein GNI_087290 [Gregarina niphandrodes]EZG62960.1 hypothetical protein GNI_087290 [Gregarina niphandrodes]|eukprot:XP_011130698.1 hypothetical protein GNI_087290 [Gregarina niphandrodes]